MTTVFLIDGFNFYHALKSTKAKNPKTGRDIVQKHPVRWKWFDYDKFCRGFLGADEVLQDIYYFTAYCIHKPDALKRQKAYLSVLEERGLKVIFGKYKKKWRECKKCGHVRPHPEEKATDVNIALEAYALASSGSAGKIFIVSGDTDLMAALIRIRKDFPAVVTEVIFPYLRHSKEFVDEGFKCYRTTKAAMENSLLPRKITMKNGAQVERPREWA
jgi:uncharacterized LabA/DUF88 family protein